MNKPSLKFRILSSMIIALIISLCMAFVMLTVNAGFIPHFLKAWARDSAIGFIVSFPISFFLPGAVMKLLDKLGIK